MPLPEHVREMREKVGNALILMPSVSMLVFDEAGRILLGKRTDNGRWAELGGIMEPGETPATAAVRECREEAGIDVILERVSGVYASSIVTYPNHDRAQYVAVAFRCTIRAGVPRVNDDESSDMRFFALDALPTDLSAEHRQRIFDAAEPGSHQPAKFV